MFCQRRRNLDFVSFTTASHFEIERVDSETCSFGHNENENMMPASENKETTNEQSIKLRVGEYLSAPRHRHRKVSSFLSKEPQTFGPDSSSSHTIRTYRQIPRTSIMMSRSHEPPFVIGNGESLCGCRDHDPLVFSLVTMRALTVSCNVSAEEVCRLEKDVERKGVVTEIPDTDSRASPSLGVQTSRMQLGQPTAPTNVNLWRCRLAPQRFRLSVDPRDAGVQL